MPLLAKVKHRMIWQFTLCFFLVNIVLSLLICINYIFVFPDFYGLTKSYLSTSLLWAFLTVSLIAQITLAYLVCFIIVNTAAIFCRRFIIIAPLSILLGGAIIFIIIADSITFRMYHMHYATLAWQVFKASAFTQVITFSNVEIIWLIAIIVILLLIEGLIAHIAWRYVNHKPMGAFRYKVAVFSVFCLITSYSLNSIARENIANLSFNYPFNHYLIKMTRLIPYYDEIYDFVLPTSESIHKIPIGKNEIFTINIPKYQQTLNYPKHPMQCEREHRPLNIVFIVIDAWRYDALSKKATPNIYQFAQQSQQFKNHWSGGNCTKAGIFSLFYGLPASYWDAFFATKKSPELIQQLLKNHYQMGIFASAKLNFPAFDQTIFSEVHPLVKETPGENTLVRDQNITKEFQAFIEKKDAKQPFFSFLFYDSVHNYCESVMPLQHFQPAISECNRLGLTKFSDPTMYFNRYLNAVYFVDNQVKKVLETLKQKKLLENTIVIITSDHGEEINDNHSGYWQHASAYTPYQLHTPLVIHWPGQAPKVYQYFTSHYDLVPTLMTSVMKCHNPTDDYTIGKPLFSRTKFPQLLISYGYSDFAIITDNNIVRLYNNGDYIIEDRKQKGKSQSLQHKSLSLAVKYLSSYFHRIK